MVAYDMENVNQALFENHNYGIFTVAVNIGSELDQEKILGSDRI